MAMKELGVITFGVVLLAIFAGTGAYPFLLRRGLGARVRARGRCATQLNLPTNTWHRSLPTRLHRNPTSQAFRTMVLQVP